MDHTEKITMTSPELPVLSELEQKFQQLLCDAALIKPFTPLTAASVDAACARLLSFVPEEKKYYFANIMAVDEGAGRSAMMVIYTDDHPLAWCRKKLEEAKLQSIGNFSGKFIVNFMAEIPKDIYDIEVKATSSLISSAGGKLPPLPRK